MGPLGKNPFKGELMIKYPTEITMLGATGLVGGELLKILSQIPEIKNIKAITRRPLGKVPPRTDNIVMELDAMESKAEALKSDIFVCCLGTTIKQAGSQEAFRKVDYEYVINFARIAEKVGAKKFLVVSAIGADANSSIFYNKTKGEMERDLKKLNIPQIEIFQPSLILGAREKVRPAEDLFQKISPVMNKLLIGPMKKYRGIKATDIAKAMTIAILDFHPGAHTYMSDKIQNIVDETSKLRP
jgi:uncharacterized protein YbjT (DUF2867 family)